VLTPSIFGKTRRKNAKDKNKSSCCKTIQKNRHGQIHFFKIPCQPYIDQEDHQAQTVFAAKSNSQQIEQKNDKAASSERIAAVY